VLGFTSGQAQKKGEVKPREQDSKDLFAPLPRSLDNLFPPKADKPIFLLKHLGLGTRFSGIVANLIENEVQHAKANFERFKVQYVEVSKLVPEWEKKYQMGPVEELWKAFTTGDRGKVMAAYEKVGKVCHDCHIVNMAKVQQKYHWGNFYLMKIKDPLSDEELDYPRLMKYLNANFAGISVSIEQGQRENAQKHLQGFNARFQAMKENCKYCHATERKYYVDESVQGLVDKLGHVLSGPSVDPKVVEALTQEIGMESCFKCHLVHVPAAFARF